MVWYPHILKVAWDATKLGVALKGYKREQAIAIIKKNQVAITPIYRRKEAIKEVRRLYEAEKYEELARLFIPDSVMDKGYEFVELWWTIWDIYWLFVILRVVLVFLPGNSGYIHPDEYFQSLEVTIGDVFDVDVHRTWEFNKTQPLRSPTVPFLLYGVPMGALKVFNIVLFHYTGLNIVGNYIVTLIPKLVLLLLSFSVDYLVYKVCKLYKHSFNQCLSTLASSYVMLVYSTRSFSNSLELVLSSILLYLVAHTIKRTDETVYLHELVHDKYTSAETIRERVEISKKRKKIPDHDYKHIVPIGVLLAVGVFNRPTFLFYAFGPIFFWLQRGVANHSYFTPFQTFNFRFVLLTPIVAVSCLVLILTDSLYYGDLTLHKLWHLKMLYTDWKVAPFNFVMYNIVPGNIVSHGEHPRYTHTLVNLPLLFGPLAPVCLLTVANWFCDVVYLPWIKKPGMRTIYALTLFSSLVPLMCLSVVRHQEARFLLPVLPCLVLMCAHKLRYKFLGFRPLLTLWYIFNVAAAVWFGFIHQAGVLPAQKHIGGLQHDARFVNLVYSHTYMPPRYPLWQPENFDKDELPPYVHNSTKFLVQDLGSIETELLYSKLLDLVSRSDYVTKKQHKRMQTYLIIPSFLLDQLTFLARRSLDFDVIYSTFPHVSVESLDKLDLDIYNEDDGSVSPVSMIYGALKGVTGFSLSIANVTLGEVTTAHVKNNAR